MKLKKEHQDLILHLNDFVRTLDERVRAAAFTFLLQQTAKSVSGDEGALTAPTIAPSVKARELSPQELIRQTHASSATTKAEVLAYWLEIHQGKETFSSADLKDAFNHAREPAPKNPSDVVARLASAGKLMPAEKVGTIQNYRLTRTAIEEVESWLQTAGQ